MKFLKTRKDSEEDRERYGLTNSEKNYWGFKDRQEMAEYNYENGIRSPDFYFSNHEFPDWMEDILLRVWEKENNPTTTTSTTTTTTTTTKKPKKKDKGYQFGDITKSVVNKVWNWWG